MNDILEDICCGDGEALCPVCNRVVDAAEMTTQTRYRTRPNGSRGKAYHARMCADCATKETGRK